MQESRAIVVTGEHHQKLWDVVTETYKKTLGGDGESIPWLLFVTPCRRLTTM
jgi:predicted oxidoreductase (fatty acid repression mutant protein)